MNGNTEQHKPGERIAKVIARAGLASRREAESGSVTRTPPDHHVTQ